jgi:alpha-beta hydrolase superfamily lysophospholipase
LKSIIAVHGLNGHREKTFQTKDGVLWLRDLLPEKLPQTRIFTWGYDANTHSSDRVTTQYLYDVANSLVEELVMQRRLTKTEKRPIIFVAHSLGGLVVKSVSVPNKYSSCH